MKQITRAALIAVIILTVSACVQASILTSAFYDCSDIFVPVPEYAFMGGSDVLPNGNYVINDGHHLREITQAGVEVGNLYTYETPQPASFVYCHNDRVYFADTGMGSSMLRSIPVAGGPATDIASIPGNYDISFTDGLAHLVANSSVLLLNVDGTTTTLATINGVWSGPHAFDAFGNLYFAPSPFPDPTVLYKWSADKVQAAAAGGASLGATNADLALEIGGAAGMFFDKQGRLVFSNNSGGVARIERWDGTSIVELARYTLTDVTSPAVTNMRYDAATGDIYAGLNYWTSDGTNPYGFNHNYLTKLTYVPEPSSLLALCSLIGLAGSAKLLRGRRK